jgi:hypothetical protein
MADPKTNDRSDEMEHDLHQLEDHIVDAEKKLEARKEEAEIVNDTAGDTPTGASGTAMGTGGEGEQDRGGGDDPEGAAADAADSSGETRSAEDVHAEVEGKMDADDASGDA